MKKTSQKTYSQKITRAIMRRVWYAYLISMMLRPGMVWGLAFGASVIGFWRLVSVSSIINNILQVRLGDIPQYVLHSLMQAETLALVAFGIIFFTILTLGIRSTVPTVRMMTAQGA